MGNGNWFMVHWLIFENFYPSLTLGALYALWRVSADTRSPTKTFEDKLCGSPLYLRLLAVYVSLLADICVLYQILSLISSRFLINVRDTALYSGRSLVRSELKCLK